MTASSADVWVHALDAFEAALAAGSEEAAAVAVRGRLASIDDPELLRRVATCLASVSVWRMPTARDVARRRRWVERVRLEVAWVGSDG